MTFTQKIGRLTLEIKQTYYEGRLEIELIIREKKVVLFSHTQTKFL